MQRRQTVFRNCPGGIVLLTDEVTPAETFTVLDLSLWAELTYVVRVSSPFMKHFIHLMIAVFICSASKRLQAARTTLPSKRSFLSINHNHNSAGLQILSNLRVLQLNVLADGLSGLRSDLGGFSRARKDWLNWDKRKHMLLREILQHDPDIITLQECDHYHDFFLPALADQFDGVFSPKPASACLEVSQRSDGCAIFVRRSKLKLVSTEVGSAVHMLMCLTFYIQFIFTEL